MAESSEFILQLRQFEYNTNTYWKKLRYEDQFSDVTLACVDKQVKAHKVVLSASSMVLENIFIHNPHPNPLIYLKGIKYSELVSLLDFIYLGEVAIIMEELNDFIAIVDELKIKGFTGENKKVMDNMLSEDIERTLSRKIKEEIYASYKYSDGNMENDSVDFLEENENAVIKPKSFPVDDPSIFTDNKDECDQLQLMSNDLKIAFNTADKVSETIEINYEKDNIIISERETDTNNDELDISKAIDNFNFTNLNIDNVHSILKNFEPITTNTPLFKQYTEESIKESKYDKDTSVQLNHRDHVFCELCPYSSKSKKYLKRHVSDKHEGIIYNCDKCEYKTSAKRYLNTHKHNMHVHSENHDKDTRVPYIQGKICKLCNFKTDNTSELHLHQQLSHQHRFFCELCDHSYKDKADLKYHVSSIHKGIFVNCDKCEFKTSAKRYLKNHKRTIHGEGGNWYFCKDCDYSTASITTFKRHKLSIHDGIRYPCGQCDYKPAEKHKLKRHEKDKHGIS